MLTKSIFPILLAGLCLTLVPDVAFADWVPPTSHNDPENLWNNESNAYDGNTSTYAADVSYRWGWGPYIYLNLSTPINCSRFRVWADYDPGIIRQVQIDVYKDGAWENVVNGAINNCSWDERTFAVGSVTQARMRYRYRQAGWSFWLYEFEFYEEPPVINPPVCETTYTSKVEENTAILHGAVTDDGGEPCEFRFQYGLTDSYGTDTPWRSSRVTGESFTQQLAGLLNNTLYHFRAQLRNSAGTSSGADMTFTTGKPPSGWVCPSGNSDPDNGWEDEDMAHDDDTLTYARYYHNVNDPRGEWSTYLNLTHSAMTSDKIRIYARGTTADPYYVDSVDVDVYRDGAWVDVYQGAFANKQWVEYNFAQGTVTEARIRFHVNNNGAGLYFELYEFNFYRLSTVAPTLTWTGETYYESDGLNPETGTEETAFMYRVEYTDADGDAPAWIKVWADKNGDGDYLDAGEELNLSVATDCAPTKRDGDYTNGEIFTVTINIPYGPNTDNCSYYFGANDGTFDATGAPTIPINAPDVVPTLVVLSDFRACEDRGQVVVRWETACEIGTAGFHLLRLDKATGKFTRVNDKMLPGLLHAPQGGTYRMVDPGAQAGKTYTYMLVEIEARGRRRTYGPFTVTVEKQSTGTPKSGTAECAPGPMYSGCFRKERKLSATKKERLRAGKSVRDAVRAARRWRRAGDRAKVAVAGDGLYYLAAGEIGSVLGLPSRQVARLIKHHRLHLSSRGREVAYAAVKGNTGIYFYGQGSESIYTRENIYWLRGGRGKRAQLVRGAAPVPVNGTQTFTETVHTEQDRYPATALFTDPQADYWLWDYVISGDPCLERKTFDLRAGGADAAGTATLTVYLQGATDSQASPDHHAVVSVNGAPIGEGRWNGTEPCRLVLTFNQNILIDGDNTVEVEGVLDTGTPFSIFYVDSFDLSYQRCYRAEGGKLLVRGDGNPVVTIEGFTNSAISVFDVSNPNCLKLVTAITVDEANGSYRVSFKPSSPDALYLALTPEGLSMPVSVVADVPSRLRRENNRADYLVIAPSGLKEAALSLASYRRGRGLETMVVELEDIYDEFNHGIAGPEAIRDFLSYAYHNWRKAPRYVVLAGDGTYDYKNNQGHGDNLLPPLMVGTADGLFASDNRFADVAGNDGVPEMALGRLPVLSNQELQSLIDKIAAYEAASGGAWEKRVLMAADDPDEGGDFPSDSDDLASLIPQGYTVDKVYLSEHTVEEARQLILNRINNGVSLLNYIGHAGVDRMAQEGLLLRRDVDLLSNGEKAPVVTALTCVAGQFAIPGYDSLGEALVLKSGGGAAAFWGPSGLSFNAEAKILGRCFLEAAFKSRVESAKMRLGEVILKSLAGYAASGNLPHMLDIYNLLGDPALEMK